MAENKFHLCCAAVDYIIIEPYDENSVFKAEETATVFKIISSGNIHFKAGDLIIVVPNSVEKTRMGNKTVYFISQSNVVAKVGFDG
jgi:hypothetical protein